MDWEWERLREENQFHVVLDADPSDLVTRLALADWLLEHDDPRGEGYRALALLGRWPDMTYNHRYVTTGDWTWYQRFGTEADDDPSCLPELWTADTSLWPFLMLTRKSAEDTAAVLWGMIEAGTKLRLLSLVGARP